MIKIPLGELLAAEVQKITGRKCSVFLVAEGPDIFATAIFHDDTSCATFAVQVAGDGLTVDTANPVKEEPCCV